MIAYIDLINITFIFRLVFAYKLQFQRHFISKNVDILIEILFLKVPVLPPRTIFVHLHALLFLYLAN